MSKTNHGIEFRKPTQATRRFRNSIKILMKHLRYNMPFPFKPVLHGIYNEHCVIGFHSGNIPYASAFVSTDKLELVSATVKYIKIEMRWRTEMRPYFDGHRDSICGIPILHKEHTHMLPHSMNFNGDHRTVLVTMATIVKEWLATLPQLTRTQGLQPCGLPYLPIIDGFAKLKTFVFGAGWEQVGPWAFDWSKPIVFENCVRWDENRFAIPKEEVLKQQHGYSILRYLVGRTVSINGQSYVVKSACTNSGGTTIGI